MSAAHLFALLWQPNCTLAGRSEHIIINNLTLNPPFCVVELLLNHFNLSGPGLSCSLRHKVFAFVQGKLSSALEITGNIRTFFDVA